MVVPQQAVRWIGKSNLTDYSHRTFGVSFAEDIIPETGPLSDNEVAKITAMSRASKYSLKIDLEVGIRVPPINARDERSAPSETC